MLLRDDIFFATPLHLMVIGWFNLFAVTNLYAETPIDSGWLNVGHGGGGVIVDVIPHPTDENIVWVETDLTGIFKSTDGGESFERKSGPIEKQELLYEWMRGLDHELAFDPVNPDIMYWAMDGGIYTEPGLYQSVNGGEDWEKLPNSPDLSPGAIVVDNNGVVYGIKHKRLYVSMDQGKSWVTRASVPTFYVEDDYYWRRQHRIFIYTTKNNDIYIGDRRDGTGMYYSADQGKSWHQVLKGNQIMDFAASPATPELMFALEQDGRIFRSEDGGKNFVVVETVKHDYWTWGTWPPFFGGIAVNKENHVIAIGREEMGVSIDAGKTFSKTEEKDHLWDPKGYIFPNRSTNRSLFKVIKLAASPASGRWYAVGGHLVKITQDNGKSWYAGSQGIDILCIYSPPVIDSTNPNRIHAVAGDNGHFYTHDLGRNWKTSEVSMGNVDGIAQDPNHPNIFYKLSGKSKDTGALYRSKDEGVTWDKLTNIPLPGMETRTNQNPSFIEGWIGRVRVDPTNSNRIYVSHRSSKGVYRSLDGGQSFHLVLTLQRPWELEVTKKGTIFINTFDSTGLYRSENHGKDFEKIHEGQVNNFVVHPNDENIIYANVGSWHHAWAQARVKTSYMRHFQGQENKGKGQLYKTEDGGKTWQSLGAHDGFALYIEPNFPQVMLMATRDGGKGILRSLDAGKSWHEFHEQHHNYRPRGFVYGGVPGRVYTWNHNFYRRDKIHQ